MHPGVATPTPLTITAMKITMTTTDMTSMATVVATTSPTMVTTITRVVASVHPGVLREGAEGLGLRVAELGILSAAAVQVDPERGDPGAERAGHEGYVDAVGM